MCVYLCLWRRDGQCGVLNRWNELKPRGFTKCMHASLLSCPRNPPKTSTRIFTIPFPFCSLSSLLHHFGVHFSPIPRYDLIQLKTRRKRNWGTALVLLKERGTVWNKKGVVVSELCMIRKVGAIMMKWGVFCMTQAGYWRGMRKAMWRLC